MLVRFFRTPALSPAAVSRLEHDASERLSSSLTGISTEYCYYVATVQPFDDEAQSRLRWLLAETYEPGQFSDATFLAKSPNVIEIGPRLNFETAASSATVAIMRRCGIAGIERVERSIRYGLPKKLSENNAREFARPLHDRMTQMIYWSPLTSFDLEVVKEPVRSIPVLEAGMDALIAINRDRGLGMDEQDLAFYYQLFVRDLKRNPTDVELFQLGQANSEHSRHWFFKGTLVIDGEEVPQTLLELVQEPWRRSPGNSLIAFCDDSSAIRGGRVPVLRPDTSGVASSFVMREAVLHPTLTAETHNFPSGVAPFPGAETGTGGRIRDNQAVGRGGEVIAGAAAYCVGNLHVPGYAQPWELDNWRHPENLASPLDILIQASNGASDYGNKFGEPVIIGFTRTFGAWASGDYRSWYKPIMYTAGVGQINGEHLTKGSPTAGMRVVQIGGPAYRIGMGGGAASSMVQGDNAAHLDFNAVQRGDAEMEQRVHRFIRACTEMGPCNPIVSIHDLGAGGDCNAVPELVDPAGAVIRLRAIPVGDRTLSTLELWGNESQERHVLLVNTDDVARLREIAARESVPFAVIGTITGDGAFVLEDDADGSRPVELPLDRVLGKLPPKVFTDSRSVEKPASLALPRQLSVRAALERVLRLPSVASKRYLTTKVDRSVTGLIAQQQCIGPNHLTLCDFAAVAQSHFAHTGIAVALGEQPLKGLVSPAAMARLAVAEMLLNLAGAVISDLAEIRCSANWMLAAKLPGEGSWLRDAAVALCEACMSLGIAIDGGKDSLSMAARVVGPGGSERVVKAPGQLVIAGYAPMPDIRAKATADFKSVGSSIVHIDISNQRYALGGSALAQAFGQVGNDVPDISDLGALERVFRAVQRMVATNAVTAVHDVSDGGLIVALLELAFAGNVGFAVGLESEGTMLERLFSESPGVILETTDPAAVRSIARHFGVSAHVLGMVTEEPIITVAHNEKMALRALMTDLREIWEEPATQLDAHQANPACVAEEADVLRTLLTPPPFWLSFQPSSQPPTRPLMGHRPSVAIVREEGTNGDREMAAAFLSAGFDTWDITMTDLSEGRVSLGSFRGIVFPGGFSYADVLDSAKGWAGVIRFNKRVRTQFDRFYERSDTFSLGVCNGCQLMALLGWVPIPNLPDELRPRFIRNSSERFESRFVTVQILPSSSLMLDGMEGSVLGIWVAHGEGRFHASSEVLTIVLDDRLAPIRYVDRKNRVTTVYPFNPNGSPEGIAGVVSPDGRHLALMPHPERAFLPWQWPWMPQAWKSLEASPWLRLFQNAYRWCTE